MLVVKLVAVLKARSGLSAAEALRIERQQLLHPQNDVSEQATHQAEKQHGQARILSNPAPGRGCDAHQSIGDPLQGLHDGIQPGPALGIQHLHQV